MERRNTEIQMKREKTTNDTKTKYINKNRYCSASCLCLLHLVGKCDSGDQDRLSSDAGRLRRYREPDRFCGSCGNHILSGNGLSSAYTLWSVLLAWNDVSKVAIFGFVNPLCSVILSALMLGEVKQAFNIGSLIALILVCTGIYIVNCKKKMSR